MTASENIENFWNAVEVADDETVSSLVDEIPIEELKRALHRCNCLVRKTKGGYVRTRNIVLEALKQTQYK